MSELKRRAVQANVLAPRTEMSALAMTVRNPLMRNRGAARCSHDCGVYEWAAVRAARGKTCLVPVYYARRTRSPPAMKSKRGTSHTLARTADIWTAGKRGTT